jgi:type IV secretory pathway VirD2 relaxase
MTREDDFEPKLGRVRATRAQHERRYLQDVLKGIARTGGKLGRHNGRFNGKHSGRGSGIGRVLAARDRYAAFRSRRVIVKSRTVKLQGKLDAARAHLRYIQRDGVTREGTPGEVYDAEHDRSDGKAFLERCDGDRHQFRYIVSADDGAEYDELKGFTRRLMQQMETDLGTKLDWVAADHYNTGHPHTHVILRGKDDHGQNLVIAREYLTQGLRERAAEIVTLDLGPRTDLEIENKLRAEIEQERFTSLDRSLRKEADEEGRVQFAGKDRNAFRHSLRMGRLQKLKRLGLAQEIVPGHWRLDPDMETALRRMGQRGDIIKTMHQALVRANEGRSVSDYVIYNPAEGDAALTGRVVVRGLSDELHDRQFLIVDGADGRSHYVDIGRAESGEAIGEGTIISVNARQTDIRPVDRTIADIAATHGGRYSVEIHLGHDPTATQAFAEAHVRRLEAMRRQGGMVEREPDGTWIIAPDHLECAAAFEQSRLRSNPVIVQTLSTLSLERQIAADGATWLDRELIAATSTPFRDAGFGKDARATLVRRQQWLIEQGLAERDRDQIVYRANLLNVLRRRELNQVGGQLSKELGLPYSEARPGQRVEGIYRRRVDLASGRFALVEKSREFTLVPWRPVLERSIGKMVAGIPRGDTISWTIGRQRSGPSIGS